MKSAKRIAATGLLLVIASCGGAGSSDSIPIDQFVVRGTDAICAMQVRCGRYPDKATCAALSYTKLQTLADIKAGMATYDGAAAARCFKHYAALSCSVSGQADSSELMQDCAGILTGGVAVGGPCLEDEVCASGFCEQSACGGAPCCVGSCKALIAVGGDCSANSANCVAGTFCKRPVTGASLCTAAIASGQPCDIGSDLCALGTACLRDSSGASVCIKPPAEGQACPGQSCDAATDGCDPTGKCTLLVPVGGTCTFATACVSYAKCDLTTSTCVGLSAPGGNCRERADCIGSAPCAAGTCLASADVPACP